MTVPSASPRHSLMRLWQPRRGLFWLVVALNVLSSVQVWYIQLADPALVLRWVLGLMALSNTAVSWWLLARLWREGSAAEGGRPAQDARR
jgi:hypothetical protein